MQRDFTFMDQLFINLSVLSQLAPGDKLLVDANMNITVDKTYFQSIRRYMSGDGREATLSALRQLVNQTRTTLELNGEIQELNNSIQLAVAGIGNLRKTYEDDAVMVGALDMFCNQLKTFLKNVDMPITEHMV